MDDADDKNMVASLLKFKEHVDDLVITSFCSADQFVMCVRDALKVCINRRQNKPAELCAKFIDSLLRKRDMPADQVECLLNKCLELFRLVDGKDVFEAFYGRDLAKRLLLARSASVDAEKSMLSKLKTGTFYLA